MVRKLLACLMAALLVPMAALADVQVIDDANILTAGEEAEITAIIDRMESKAAVDVVVLTTRDTPVDNTYSMTFVRDYADDYYDYNGYGVGPDHSGMLFLVDMHNRIMWISTCGSMISTITDDREDAILDAAYTYMSEGDYGRAISRAMEKTERCLYNWLSAVDMLIAAGGGVLIALSILGAVSGSYNLKGSTYSYDLAQNSASTMLRDDEEYLRQAVTRTARSTGSSSGGSGRSGGGGVHRSSSGRSHGGGGRRF